MSYGLWLFVGLLIWLFVVKREAIYLLKIGEDWRKLVKIVFLPFINH
jgi:hypothetical protein